ncbi:MAG: class I SAM-dependent methyltransferase [Chitinophagaceae bacterium]
MRFTQDAPNESSIGTYYQSENYISHTNSNKGIVNGLYHIIRRITLLQKHRLIQSITGMPTGSLLDLGAGAGTFAAFMQLSDWKVTALEPDLTAREIALKTNGISLLPSQQLFQLTENSYDAITLWHVLEHVHTLEAYIAQLKKILKPTGRLFIAVPNYTSFDAALYKEHWAAYDVPRHLYHFSPSAMRQLLKQHDLTIESIKPMWFDSFYVSILSEKYKGSKLRLLKGAWNGFISNLKALFHKEKCSSLIYIIRK